MTEHIPTPWKVSIESHADYITDRQGHVLVSLSDIGSNPIEKKEIAELIVEAVNNHEALKARVAELEQHLHSLLEMPIVCNVHNGVIEIENYKRRKAARAALREKGEK